MLRMECVLPAWQICCRTMQSVCVVEMRLNLRLCLSVQLGTLVLGWLSRSEASFLVCLVLLLRLLGSHHTVHLCMMAVLRHIVHGRAHVEVGSIIS